MRYGAQIAGALAHTQGRHIIHWDLRSSYIIVTPKAGQDEATWTMGTLESAVAIGGTLC